MHKALLIIFLSSFFAVQSNDLTRFIQTWRSQVDEQMMRCSSVYNQLYFEKHIALANQLYLDSQRREALSTWEGELQEFFCVKRNGKALTRIHADSIVLYDIKHAKNLYAICLFPDLYAQKTELEDEINSYATIMYAKDFILKNEGPCNYLRMLFDHESWNPPSSKLIIKKDCLFDKASDEWMLRVYFIECEQEQLEACANTLHEKYKELLYISKCHADTMRIAQSVLNDNSLHFLNYARFKKVRLLRCYFDRYKKWITTASDVDDECFCIDGGAVLAAYGIQDCNDVDYLHCGHEGFLLPSGAIESHNRYKNLYTVGKDEIIFNPKYHFYYRGCKFASLDLVCQMKLNRGKRQDVQDINFVKRTMLPGT